MEKQCKRWLTLLILAPKSLQMVIAAMKLKDAYSLEGKWPIEKQRHYFANKGPSSQGYGISSGHVWLWEWTVKKSEYWRIDAFELCCWRRLLWMSWTARRSNQSILKEISPGCSLKELMLKLKLQYFGQLKGRAASFEKALMLGKIEGRRRRGRQRMRLLDGITDSIYMSWVISWSWWWTGRPGMLLFLGLQRVGHDWVNELNWTEPPISLYIIYCTGMAYWTDWLQWNYNMKMALFYQQSSPFDQNNTE